MVHSLAMLPIGANGAGKDHCQKCPEGITCDAKRPTVIFPGFMLERREDGLPRKGAGDGRDGGQQCPGSCTGGSPLCAIGAKAKLPVRKQ